ncbi:MAG: ATP-dependent helicase [Tissierellia bacterium]|nr:ATP-dependent helicase [Tissierellia bacterium]
MKFSKEQLEAIYHNEGPCLVLAVPGAGKTTILIHRILHLIQEASVSPSEILALTFTKASAMDMRKRIHDIEPKVRVQHIKTIHSLCYEILSYKASMDRIRFSMIEGPEFRKIRYDILNEIHLSYHSTSLTQEEYILLLQSISLVKSRQVSLDASFEKEISIENFVHYFYHYENYKEKHNLYDFDDLLIKTREALTNDASLKNHYKNKFKYVLLDEAQDTSSLQWEIIKLLLTKKMNIFAVADDDQSIYRFRGAYPEMLMRFSTEFPGASIRFLQTNYRSVSEIVNSANRLIKNNRIRYEKEISAIKEKISTVKVGIFKSRTSQYEFLIKNLREHRGSKAIIYRNNLSAIGLMDVLDRNLIPFQLQERQPDFFNHFILRDIFQMLSFISDNTSWEHYKNIYYKLQGYLTRDEVLSLQYMSEEKNVFDRILRHPTIPSYKKEKLAELRNNCNLIQKHFPKRGLEILLKDCGYYNYLARIKREQSRGVEGYMKMFRTLQFISHETKNIDHFLQRLDELKQIAMSQTSRGVKLISMHASKGLEFDTVFLVDLLDQEIPGYKSNAEDLEEERRLLYVGMTRAKNSLFMLSYKEDEGEKLQPTRFLNELK